jgi:hypothetical protein
MVMRQNLKVFSHRYAALFPKSSEFSRNKFDKTRDLIKRLSKTSRYRVQLTSYW